MNLAEMRSLANKVQARLEKTKEGPCGPGSGSYEDLKSISEALLKLLDRVDEVTNVREFNQRTTKSSEYIPYFHGMTNGMIMAELTLGKTGIEFVSAPGTTKDVVRVDSPELDEHRSYKRD